MDQVKALFEKYLNSYKVVLTISQLWDKIKQAKLDRLVSKKQVIDFLKLHPVRASFGQTSNRPAAFQTVHFAREGVYFIDYGEFRKSWAGHNNGKTGFLVAVENLSNRLFVLPTKGKASKQWLDSIQKFVEMTRNVKTIFSDRDAVATSPKFRKQITQLYNIRWYFLRKGNKSFLAERYVGFVKTKLSQMIEQTGSKKWIDLVDPLVKEYNAEKIAGTSYRRRQITNQNFLHFYSQLIKESDPELLFNAQRVGEFSKASDWNKQIFKFALGQKVLLLRKANWKTASSSTDLLGTGSKSKAGKFFKPSSQGRFSKKLYTVSGRQLRMDKTNRKLIPVYSLSEMENHLHFYDNELKAVRQNNNNNNRPQ